MKLRHRFLKAVLVASLLAGGASTVPVTASPAAAQAPLHGCNPGELCLYRYNYQHMVARMKSCKLHDVRDKYFLSYVNNQTRGTRGRFYGGGPSNLTLLSYTKPAVAKGTTSLGLQTTFVRPC